MEGLVDQQWHCLWSLWGSAKILQKKSETAVVSLHWRTSRPVALPKTKIRRFKALSNELPTNNPAFKPAVKKLKTTLFTVHCSATFESLHPGSQAASERFASALRSTQEAASEGSWVVHFGSHWWMAEKVTGGAAETHLESTGFIRLAVWCQKGPSRFGGGITGFALKDFYSVCSSILKSTGHHWTT